LKFQTSYCKIIFFSIIIISSNNYLINAQTSDFNIKRYDEIADKIIRSSLTENKGYKWLKELCTIGPRLSGSKNSMKAIHWAEKKMKEIGFDSVWLQKVMVPKWVRGNLESAFIAKSKKYKNKKLVIASYGGSIGTPTNGITAEVLEVKSLTDVKTLGDKAKEKIIFYNRPFDNGLLHTFEGYGGAVDQRTMGAVEAAKVGAVAVIVRSVQSGYDNVPHTGSMHYENGVTKIPSAAIGVIDSDLLSKILKEEPNLKITIKMNCVSLSEVESFNVIGQLTGSKFPNEVIAVGGHFDSWDKGCGAHDDGAPCIQTMEALDLFKRFGIKPQRTLRCVLFINEENGLRGGVEYGKFAEASHERHVAAIESDRGAFTPQGFSVTSDSLTLLKIQSWLPILNKANIDWIKKGGSGGDVAQIKNTIASLGFVPDDQRYMDLHHSGNDVFAAVHPREMELGSAAIALISLLLSDEGL
jgi:carboxypeptidase Q